MGFNVAIDGPAGAGKSSVAKKIAKKMHFIYVDTGAMYRTIALYLLRNQVNPDSEEAVTAVLPGISVTIGYEDGAQQVYLNGENVSGEIRTQEVGELASKTSQYAAVRAHLLELQRSLARENDVLMDGRDIGTAILPDADLKVFLSADPKVRAERRYLELTGKGVSCDKEEILKEILERDYRDSHREISPLRQAEDAVVLDTSYMNIDEVVQAVVDMIHERRKA